MAYIKNPHAASAAVKTPMTAAAAANLATHSITGTLSISPNGNAYGYTSPMNVAIGKPSGPPAPPANWTVVKPKSGRYEDTCEIHESPVNGAQVFIGSLSISNHNSRHHWNLFARLHPEIEYLLCAIAESDEVAYGASISNVIFTNQRDFQTFENWLVEYKELFGSTENLYSYRLPPPPKVMERSVQVDIGTHDLLDLCEWIISNCEDKVYHLGEMMFFLNDNDAMLYKLKFSK